jgi:outer membrane protein assembly factor BamB
MAYSVVVINRRDLKKKFARPQSQLHLVDDLLIVCVDNEGQTQGFIYALEHEQPGMPERWLVSLPATYTARFAVYLSKYNQIVVSVSNWRTALGKNSYLLAIDAATGQEVWRYPEQKELVNLSAPVLVQDNVFVVTTGYVLLLSPENPRKPVWSQPFPFTPHWFYNGITSNESMIYISAKKSGVIGLGQQTGQVEKQYSVSEGEVWLAAAVDDQNLIVGTSTGQLIAFDKVATHQKWCMQVGREITTARSSILPIFL